MSDFPLECENVTKSFFGVPVLRNVSLSLKAGHLLGIVGENGAGKSTLMNILGGVLRADSGSLRLGGKDYSPHDPAEAFRDGIAFIHQELNLFTNLSVAENLFIAGFPKTRIVGLPLIRRKALRQKTQVLLASVDLHVSAEALVEDLSPGERQLVEIARALGADAEIIIFDEPTTSLSSRETERLFGIIERFRRQGISMIYISHNLGDVLRLCDDIVVLRDGEVVGVGAKEEFTLEKIISLMVGRSMDQLYPPRSAPASSEIVLEVMNVSQRGIVENISFSLHKGEILGVSGLLGSGRTELARILFGLEECDEGEILLHVEPLKGSSVRERIRRGMAFCTEDRRAEGLLMDASVEDNIALVSLPSFGRSLVRLLERCSMRQAVGRAAEAVRLHCGSLSRQTAKTLSGGNQQKTVIAKWLLENPSVVLLDEPTRGIDVGAKYEVYKIMDELATQGAGILFISSEIEELMGMCDRIMVMANGEIRSCMERARFHKEKILWDAFMENPLL